VLSPKPKAGNGKLFALYELKKKDKIFARQDKCLDNALSIKL